MVAPSGWARFVKLLFPPPLQSRLVTDSIAFNKMSCNEQQDCFSVRRRKGPHPGLGCPVAAVGAVIHGLECVSLHDSQLAKGATQGLLRREIPPVLRVFGHLKPYLSLRNAPL